MVSQEIIYGGAVTGLPTGAESTKNATLAIGWLLEAVAKSVTVENRIDPAVGLVSCTVGKTVPLLETVIRATGEVPMTPVGSVVWTASQWVPLATVVVSHAILVGTMPPNDCPSIRNCTPLAVPVEAVN